VPLQPGDVIVVCLLAFAMVGVPAAVAYFVFGLLRREPPTDARVSGDASAERAGAAPRHTKRRSSHTLAARRAPPLDLRNRFGRR
jgi:hypothetical protein